MTEHENTERALRKVAAQERARRAELAAVMEAIPAAVFVVHDALCLSMTANQFAHDLLRVPPGHDISKSAPLHCVETTAECLLRLLGHCGDLAKVMMKREHAHLHIGRESVDAQRAAVGRKTWAVFRRRSFPAYREQAAM